MDDLYERTIQVRQDMLRSCVIDFGGHWDRFLSLAEFAYNSYHCSIDMTPFEALHGKRCRSPIGWFDAFEVRPWGTDLLRESSDKVKMIQENSWLLRVGRKRDVSYELSLPPRLSTVHPVFHVFMLKRYHGDGLFIIRWDSILLDKNMSYEKEPIVILDREVRKLRSKEIASVEVQWKNRPVDKATWEIESDIWKNYPQRFTELGTFSLISLPYPFGDERVFNWYLM
ncbi:uncharacterized protein LOC132637526 [Lycium barbarum]|uniref:uncharacterized protein LOC132637526 n=1 Tax=Lycium barbarum TaxID=112863 RepID=UPI00293EC13F|nr:uncharacterized protein LOC132637526 [Lycium barbarum]